MSDHARIAVIAVLCLCSVSTTDAEQSTSDFVSYITGSGDDEDHISSTLARSDAVTLSAAESTVVMESTENTSADEEFMHPSTLSVEITTSKASTTPKEIEGTTVVPINSPYTQESYESTKAAFPSTVAALTTEETVNESFTIKTEMSSVATPELTSSSDLTSIGPLAPGQTTVESETNYKPIMSTVNVSPEETEKELLLMSTTAKLVTANDSLFLTETSTKSTLVTNSLGEFVNGSTGHSGHLISTEEGSARPSVTTQGISPASGMASEFFKSTSGVTGISAQTQSNQTVASYISSTTGDLTTPASNKVHCLISLTLNVTWSDDLKNASSAGYHHLKAELEQQLTAVYFGTDDFDYVRVVYFLPGSIVVFITCAFNTRKTCLQNPNVAVPLVRYLLSTNNTFQLSGYGRVTATLGDLFEEDIFDTGGNITDTKSVLLQTYCLHENGTGLCLNGGTCGVIFDLLICRCGSNYAGSLCESTKEQSCVAWIAVDLVWIDSYANHNSLLYQYLIDSLTVALHALYAGLSGFIRVTITGLTPLPGDSGIQVEHNVVINKSDVTCPYTDLGLIPLRHTISSGSSILLPGFGQVDFGLLLLWNQDPRVGGGQNLTAVMWLSYCTGRPAVPDPCFNDGQCALRENTSQPYCRCLASYTGPLCDTPAARQGGKANMSSALLSGIVTAAVIIFILLATCLVMFACTLRRKKVVQTRKIVIERIIERESPRYLRRMFVRYTPRMAWFVRPVEWMLSNQDRPDTSLPPTPDTRRRPPVINATFGRSWDEAASFYSEDFTDVSSDSAIGRDSRGSSRRSTPFGTPYGTPMGTPRPAHRSMPNPASSSTFFHANVEGPIESTEEQTEQVWYWDNTMRTRRTFGDLHHTNRNPDPKWTWKLGRS